MPEVVLSLGDNVSTDILYPGRFMATVLPDETPQYAFADLSVNASLVAGKIPPGSVIVAGRNFGCGSSREQAASCLAGWGLTVIAKDFARIFLQNAVNLGLHLVICPTIQAREGDALKVHPDRVENRATGEVYPTVPLPAARQAIIDAGGLIPYARARLMAERGPA